MEATNSMQMVTHQGVFSYGYKFVKNLLSKCRWRPTSDHELELIETQVVSNFKRPFKIYDVTVDSIDGSKEPMKIRTIEMGTRVETTSESNQEEGTPIVLMHGFASAIGLWLFNLDSIAASNRRVN